MFATKLKVASALFLSSFIIWLALILLAAQPTDNLAQFQFSDSSLLAVFLGSAIAASLSSMVIGLDLLELRMKPMSLTKKFGIGRVSLRSRKSKAVSPKQQDKDSKVELEKLQASQTELDADTPSLGEEIILPDRSLSTSQEVIIEKLTESGKTAEENLVQLNASMLSKPPRIETCHDSISEKEPCATVVKNAREVDAEGISCPICGKVFKIPLVTLDFAVGKNRLVRLCPYCNSALASSEEEQTTSAGCQHWFGYLAQKETGEAVPGECIECEKATECLLKKEGYSTEAVNEIKKWLH